MVDSIEKIVSLCKRRGFVYPGSEIYGGLANSWDYGPLGAELKNNIKQLWWRKFVHGRDDMVGIDAALIMNPKVWEASGHLKEFKDPLVECKKCHKRFRADEVSGNCPECGSKKSFGEARDFNLMFKTFLGPSGDSASVVYLRPETAQAMFVDFKNVLGTTRKTIPFGIAQIGKAFRNEITPGNFIFRTREFEQMEIEYFIKKENWQESFEHWRREMLTWMEDIGLDLKHIHELEVPATERAHYSKRTIDFEYDFPFGREELYGLAYRTDFDLRNHFKEPPYRDAATGEEFYPHVIEPTWGVDRSVLAVLSSAYDDSDKSRMVLKLKPQLAPYKVAVFPLSANKPDLVAKARSVYSLLTSPLTSLGGTRDKSLGAGSGLLPVAWDDRGNVGKRYYSQDEIGTPYCITVDYQTLEDETVTVRDRDTTKQDRIKIELLPEYLMSRISGNTPKI